MAFDGGGQTGKARTDDQEVNGLVPLGGNGSRLSEGGNGNNTGSAGGSQRADEAAAGKRIGHFSSPTY